MLLLSIIIPAYNAERYITECIKSCFSIQQDKGLREDELEVIVVDDGSTDATPLLLEEAKTQHPNLCILRQKNQGQSVARNLAIEKAQGRYIYMVDADDAMNSGTLLPIRDIKDGIMDIIGVQVLYQRESGTIAPWSHQMEHWPFDQLFDSGADFVRSHNIEGLVYGYLFRRQLFIEHPELRFTPGIYHQDEELIFKIFTLAGKTVYRRGYTYIYYEHSGSSINTKTAERKQKLMDDFVTILNNLILWRDRFGVNSPNTKELKSIMHYKLSYLSMDMLRMLIKGEYESQYILSVIKKLTSFGLYPLPLLGGVKYLMMKLLCCHPLLVCWWARHQVLSKRIGF